MRLRRLMWGKPRLSAKQPSLDDLVFSLMCGKAEPIHTSGGKAAIFHTFAALGCARTLLQCRMHPPPRVQQKKWVKTGLGESVASALCPRARTALQIA